MVKENTNIWNEEDAKEEGAEEEGAEEEKALALIPGPLPSALAPPRKGDSLGWTFKMGRNQAQESRQ